MDKETALNAKKNIHWTCCKRSKEITAQMKELKHARSEIDSKLLELAVERERFQVRTRELSEQIRKMGGRIGD